ncbi:MAG: hypothetical protein CENE_02947 [Candidatus Celerinatantimonas neptuna]|nr:MAG: hypothetical protein CENE_02947 [Candidatus Celerinatantimonas neptuna]
MNINRRQLLKTGALCLLGSLFPPVFAQSKSLHKILFGYGPTGIGTPLGRGICKLLKRDRYQFENNPGHHSETATMMVKQAQPDGSTILMAKSPTMTLYPYVYQQLNYQVNDFQPLVSLGQYTLILTVGPLVPKSVGTLDQFCDWINDHPQFRGLGFTNYESPAHLAKLMIARNRRYAFQAIAYAGTSMVINDLVANNLAAGLIASGNGHHYFERKILRPIMVTSKQRFAPLPDIPCASELGLSDMNITGWYGLMLQKQTSSALFNDLLSQFSAIEHSEHLHQLQQQLHLNSGIFNPDRFRRQIQQELVYYQKMTKRYNMDAAFKA